MKQLRKREIEPTIKPEDRRSKTPQMRDLRRRGDYKSQPVRYNTFFVVGFLIAAEL